MRLINPQPMDTCDTCSYATAAYEAVSCQHRKIHVCSCASSRNYGCKLDPYEDSCPHHNKPQATP